MVIIETSAEFIKLLSALFYFASYDILKSHIYAGIRITMKFFIVKIEKDKVYIMARAESEGIIGDLFDIVIPGEKFAGYSCG